MPPLAAIKAFLGKRGKLILIALAAALLCFTLGYCKGQSSATDKYRTALAEANTAALETDKAASDAAAAARVDDALAVDTMQEELSDAIKDTPDTAPDAVRVELGCQRLRAQGTDTAAIPACR